MEREGRIHGIQKFIKGSIKFFLSLTMNTFRIFYSKMSHFIAEKYWISVSSSDYLPPAAAPSLVNLRKSQMLC